MVAPTFDPVAFSVGPIDIRWYSLAYIFGIIGAYLVTRFYSQKYRDIGGSSQDLDDLVFWIALGIVLGGRLGYILLYRLEYFLDNPIKVFALNEGGMAFHGGLLGVIFAFLYVSRWSVQRALRFSDAVACGVPIGLLFGRLANFVNGELVGRVTDVPWGMIFLGYDGQPRHPSTLYEAALEGVVLFIILNVMVRFRSIRNRRGLLTGVFLMGYGAARIFVELFREPDAELILGFTRGTAYSMPMVLAGAFLVVLAFRSKPSVAVK